MLGTLLIAIPGYGMALLCLITLAAAIRRLHQSTADAPVGEAGSVFFYASACITFAAVTRWLLGGAL